MQSTIRAATSEDLPAILEIYNDVVKTTTAIYEESLRTIEEHREWFNQKTQSGFPVFVIEHEHQLVGYCSYGPFRPWTGYRQTVELGLHVASKYRGKGFGSSMLEFLIKNARSNGFHVILAGIDSNNATSVSLHQKFGFKKAGELHQVARKFGKWLDLILMELKLAQESKDC